MTQSKLQSFLPTGTDTLTMSSREIASVVGKRHDNVRRTIETLAVQEAIQLPQIEEVKNHLGQTVMEYQVNERSSYIVVAQLSPEFTALLVDHWMKRKTSSLPNFNNPIIAARAWADEREARQVAEQKKAEIGSRREATAMNTASQQSKRANKLAGELDRSKQYASVKRMEAVYEGQKFQWRPLKKTSESLGIAIIKVFDANYGEVNTYHCDVWQEVFGLEVPNMEIAA